MHPFLPASSPCTAGKWLGVHVSLAGCTALCIGFMAYGVVSHEVSPAFAETCGDNVAEYPMEACDGSDLRGNSCETFGGSGTLGCNVSCTGFDTSGCTFNSCGDGNVAGGEACDDGNASNGDGCSSSCFVETDWSCGGNPSSCTYFPPCGNGVIDGGESCDDGNLIAGDGCSASCSSETGYSCGGAPSVCNAVCGDGSVKGSEQCDDGNVNIGDGCDSSCNRENGYACNGEPSSCATVCGDGLWVGNENCDDGNLDEGDGCNSLCNIDEGWTCTGALNTTSMCTFNCGNGQLDAGETCDDDNLLAGDGCDASCDIESGWSCDGGNPDVCTEDIACGNNDVEAGEECDDGATHNGDGCSSTCEEEPGYACTGDPSDCEEVGYCGDVGCAAETASFGYSSYYLFDAYADWDEAQATCTALGGTLAAVTSAEEQSVVAGIANAYDNVWIGLRDTAAEGVYEWVTGEAFSYSNWEASQPDNAASGEDCVDMNEITLSSNEKWNDIACSQEGTFVCEVTSQTCGDGDVEGSESCDDGNAVSGDGCSSSCAVESSSGNSSMADSAASQGGGGGRGGNTDNPPVASGRKANGVKSEDVYVPPVPRLPNRSVQQWYTPALRSLQQSRWHKAQAGKAHPAALIPAAPMSRKEIDELLAAIHWASCEDRDDPAAERRAKRMDAMTPDEQRRRIAQELRMEKLSTRGAVMKRIAELLCLPMDYGPTPYKDLDPNSPYAPAIRALTRKELITGYLDESGRKLDRIGAEDPIATAEIAVLLSRLRIPLD